MGPTYMTNHPNPRKTMKKDKPSSGATNGEKTLQARLAATERTLVEVRRLLEVMSGAINRLEMVSFGHVRCSVANGYLQVSEVLAAGEALSRTKDLLDYWNNGAPPLEEDASAVDAPDEVPEG